MGMNICGYCFLGFEREIDTIIKPDISALKESLDRYVNEVDVLFGQKVIKSKIHIEFDRVNDSKYLNSKIYPFVEKNGLIKSIFISDISQILIKNIFEYKKVFDPNIEIWTINPNLKHTYSNPNSKYVYTIFSIYKIISLYDMDIFNMFDIDSNFNLIQIKFGVLEDEHLQSNFQNYATQEIHSKMFNPKLCL
jgi:hypothetical protein